MKKILTILIILIASLPLFAQTDGISYQAVIIDPDAKEIPGVDVVGNILPNATIAIRFTIFDANNTEEFTEVQTTETDQFGMINLTIGLIEHDDFTLISWDGTAKDLSVEIDFSGTGNEFLDLSRQELLFAPYAYHRDITATGTLMVDGVTNLNSELTVEAPTNLNSSLDVNNQNNTNLTGMLNVDGVTDLNSDLNVIGSTSLMDSLNVNLSPSLFDGNITVEDTATFNGPALFNAPVNFVEITVDGPSYLNGQVTVDAATDTTLGDQDNYNAYPLLVQGSNQGIAIKVNGARSVDNNYLSFWDAESGNMWGRIEGQTIGDLNSDPEYIIEWGSKAFDIGMNSYELVSNIAELIIDALEVTVTIADVRACVGLGACVTVPPPGKIGAKIAGTIKTIADLVVNGVNIALAIADEAIFVGFAHANIGVSYQSGAGDYAEWLPKENPNEEFIVGELVGVKNGFVSKNTFGADKVMVISTNPIILGNMPQEMDESKYEKIAFMGQVPVRVLGKVQPGDYILPSELGSGFGKAVHPDDMTVRDYKKIVGVAWAIMSQITDGINIVNVAVGLNTNDLANIVANQEEKLATLQIKYSQLNYQLEQSSAVLAELLPSYAESVGYDPNTVSIKSIENVNMELISEVPCDDCPEEDNVIIIEFSRELMETGINMAREDYKKMYKESNQLDGILGLDKIRSKASSDIPAELSDLIMPIDEHPFWKRMDSDPAYKEEILQYIKSSVEKGMKTHDLSNSLVKYNIEFVNF